MSSDLYWLKTDLLENVFDSYVDFLTEFYLFYGRIWTLSMCCDVVEYLSLYIYNTTVDKETKTAADDVLIKQDSVTFSCLIFFSCIQELR